MPLNNVSGSIIVTDNNGNTHTINAGNLPFQKEEIHQSQQGNEVVYACKVEENDYLFTVEVTEYPLGVQDGDDKISDPQNCTVQSNLNYDFEP